MTSSRDEQRHEFVVRALSDAAFLLRRDAVKRERWLRVDLPADLVDLAELTIEAWHEAASHIDQLVEELRAVAG